MAQFVLNGKIRDEKNRLVHGFTVEAYDSDLLSRDDLLGKTATSKGKFCITFDSNQYNNFFEFDGMPDVYLVIRDKKGKKRMQTLIKKTKSQIEYQIMLGANISDATMSDIYADNTSRIMGMMSGVGEMVNMEYRIDLGLFNRLDHLPDETKKNIQQFIDSHQNRVNNFESFSSVLDGTLTSLQEERRLGRIGYDGAHVPSRPRKESYNKVIAWSRNKIPDM